MEIKTCKIWLQLSLLPKLHVSGERILGLLTDAERILGLLTIAEQLLGLYTWQEQLP